MNFLSEAASIAIAISAVLTYYTALIHLTRRKFNRSYAFRIGRDLVVGTQTLQLYFLAKNLHLEYPFLLYPFITLLFISGPLNYIRYYMFLYPGKKVPLLVKAQIIPAAIIWVWETWFYFINHNASQTVITMFDNPSRYLITYLIAVGVIVSFVQYMMLLWLQIGFLSKKESREPVLLSSTIMGLFMLDIFLIASGFVFRNRGLLLAGILFLGITVITYLLFENRYPDFYQLVARQERAKKYKKSLILGLSREKIIDRLRELMEVEKVYRQFDLKLEEVAAMLMITPHQLSEFVNDCVGMNFASYINHYRVEEARQLLLENPEQSTLSIGFDVGFGSKQSFNTIFKQQTGMTPSVYRKIGRYENSKKL